VPLLLLLLVAGVLEISVLVVIGQAIGVLPTIGLLIAAAALGTWLLRREGSRTLREFSEAARLRRPPTREFADGVLIAAGGILIVLPGFVSDIAGLLCLLPPTRALMRRRLERAAERRSQSMQQQMWVHSQRVYGDPTGRPSRNGGGDVIDGEVVSMSDDDTPSHDQPRKLPPDTSS
jgi:UPF0716 protein FxsA